MNIEVSFVLGVWLPLRLLVRHKEDWLATMQPHKCPPLDPSTSSLTDQSLLLVCETKHAPPPLSSSYS